LELATLAFTFKGNREGANFYSKKLIKRRKTKGLSLLYLAVAFFFLAKSDH